MSVLRRSEDESKRRKWRVDYTTKHENGKSKDKENGGCEDKSGRVEIKIRNHIQYMLFEQQLYFSLSWLRVNDKLQISIRRNNDKLKFLSKTCLCIN